MYHTTDSFRFAFLAPDFVHVHGTGHHEGEQDCLFLLALRLFPEGLGDVVQWVKFLLHMREAVSYNS